MSEKKLSVLVIIAAISIVLAVFVWNYSETAPDKSASGGVLIQGLDPDTIVQIEIKSKDSTPVLLKRSAGEFAVAEKAYYPVAAKNINELLTSVMDVKIIELCTEAKNNHADLGVAEPNCSYVKFLDSKGQLIAGAVFGNRRDDGNAYARLVDSDKVYVVEKTPWLKANAMDYIDSKLFSVKKENIKTVEISSADGKYRITAEEGGKTVLQGVPANKQQKQSECDSVFSNLSYFNFQDVQKQNGTGDLDFSTSYMCELKDSTVYDIKIAKKGDDTFIKCSADFKNNEPVQKAQGVESEEELKKKEAILLAREAVVKFNEAHKGWVYKIADYKAKNLVKPFAELIEDVSAETEEKPEDANSL